MTKNNPFAQFLPADNEKAFIETLNSEITFRKLTMKEDDEFSLRLLKGSDQKNPTMNLQEATLIKYEKIALCLVEPKVTVKELQSMVQDLGEVIVEILGHIEKGNKVIDDKGNSES